ncbi:hypothetical protein H8356DRAFT_1359881 [Neocallimastix lanati (nom. inval.)]|nr:hypothetical protein H8356DRAFT_1359881 [Neocallimastix sp. JGI-2020a]
MNPKPDKSLYNPYHYKLKKAIFNQNYFKTLNNKLSINNGFFVNPQNVKYQILTTRYKKVSSYLQRVILWLPLTNKSTQLEDYYASIQETLISSNSKKRFLAEESKTNKTVDKRKLLQRKLQKWRRRHIRDLIQNNLKHNILNIQGKYNRMVIPSVKWIHSNNISIIKT